MNTLENDSIYKHGKEIYIKSKFETDKKLDVERDKIKLNILLSHQKFDET